jgi:3-oxoacyl-[acyl-carrier protein] reductase
MERSAGRVVIMTGANSGLGLAMTLALLEAGYRVSAVARSASAMEQLVATAGERGWGDQLLPALADIRSPEACAQAVEDTLRFFGRVDALVNNAGANVPANPFARFADVPVAMWDEVFATNVNGPFYLAKLVTPHLVRGGWGRIVNHVTSFPTMVRGGYTPYGPSKAALEAATLAWSAELAGTGVTVNALLPGGGADTRRVPPEPGQDRSGLVPPSAMVGPILWLLSPTADGVTGMRVIAKLWSPTASEAENVANAVQPAWRER